MIKYPKKLFMRLIAILLALIMMMPTFPILPGVADFTVYAAADPGWMPGPGEALVFTQAELHNILLGNNTGGANIHINKIYLGANINFGTSSINLNSSNTGTPRPSLTIDGMNPRTGTMHTLTMGNVMSIRNTNTVTELKFQNILLRQSSGTNGFVGFQASTTGSGVTIIFENADIVTYRTVLPASADRCRIQIIDSFISSTNDGASATRLIFAGHVEFYGDVTINTRSGQRGIFGVSPLTAPTFTVTEGANVSITSLTGPQASLFNNLIRFAFTVEKNASFSYTGGNLGYDTGTTAMAREITVENNATCVLNLRGNRSRLRAGDINVRPGASLYLWTSTANASANRNAVQANSITLNNPFRVVFATAGSGTTNHQLFDQNTNLNALSIKSIRYFTSGAGSFGGQMNYIGDTRTNFSHWWFQQQGLFNVEAARIGNTSLSVTTNYNPASNIMPGATSNLNSTNFRANLTRAVQIDGGSRAPIIDRIYAGARVVTGIGQPGAEVTVTWPTTSGSSDTPKTTVSVDSNGEWSAFVPDGLFLGVSDASLESQIMATQRETLYNLDRGESYPDY